MIAPLVLIPKGKVPCKEPGTLPACGASNVVKAPVLYPSGNRDSDCPRQVVPHDGSTRSKAPAKSTLAGARARARNIVCGDDAILIPQETVVRIDPVIVESCDLPTWADCEGKRTLAASVPAPGTSNVVKRAISYP